MKKFVTIGYSYDELTESAKEKVKQWYLDKKLRNNDFYNYVKEFLKYTFPKSSLNVQYSLSYCQGDGLNIYGELNLYDFVDHWKTSKEEKQTISSYLYHSDLYLYEFTENRRYCYSCKFIDKNDIGYCVDELVYHLAGLDFKPNRKLIEKFYTDMFEYFEQLDKQFEKDGYKYLYECDDEEVKEFCDANDYYFTENGEFIG